ncbi:type II secretion system protein [Acidaminococcus timonensis]|jgi:general secretion pathway protein G|uniref:type II secretion system protein n=1 Tax=Acidaminococcus timonensis TaxID=1871002 RepID=UPI003A5BA206
MQTDLKSNGKPHKKSGGFTLIEIIAVMAIIGGLAAALLPSINTAMNKSRDSQLISNLAVLESGAKMYQLETGKAPGDIDTLRKGKYVPDREYQDIQMEGAGEGGEIVFQGRLSDGRTVKSNELGTTKNGEGA